MKRPPLIIWACGAAIGLIDGALAGGLSWGWPGVLSGISWGAVIGALCAGLGWAIHLRRRSKRATLIARILAETLAAGCLGIFIANVSPAVLIMFFWIFVLWPIILTALWFGILFVGFLLGMGVAFLMLKKSIALRESEALGLGALFGSFFGEMAVAVGYMILKHNVMPDGAGLASALALAAATSFAITGALLAAEISAWRRRRAKRGIPPEQASTDGV